jgi:hypothetical protein
MGEIMIRHRARLETAPPPGKPRRHLVEQPFHKLRRPTREQPATQLTERGPRRAGGVGRKRMHEALTTPGIFATRQRERNLERPRLMKTFLRLLVVLPWLLGVARAAPLSEAKVPEAGAERSAEIGDVVRGADILRTGEKSLAEMEFADRTLTRLGPLSVFSFQAREREFQLKEGLGLFCLPKGSGGGRIVTAAITAAIEGTTVLALGVGKIVFLEGTGKVTTNDGQQQKAIRGGEIAYLENGKLVVRPIDLPPILRSRFIRERPRQLPNWPQIQAVVRAQERAGFGDASGAGLLNDGLSLSGASRSQQDVPLLP